MLPAQAKGVDRLLALPISYAGKDWPLEEYVHKIKSEAAPSCGKTLKPYQDKAMKRALRQGAKRTDLGPGKQPPPTWRDLVAAAATAAEAGPRRPIGIQSFTPEENQRAFFLRATANHKAGRAAVGKLLPELEEMHWKGWGNPFTVEPSVDNGFPPDYFAIIARPMSLHQIRKSYEKDGTYDLDQFRRDMALMLDNAMTFNRPGEPVHGMAADMQARFGKLLEAAAGTGALPQGSVVTTADPKAGKSKKRGRSSPPPS